MCEREIDIEREREREREREMEGEIEIYIYIETDTETGPDRHLIGPHLTIAFPLEHDLDGATGGFPDLLKAHPQAEIDPVASQTVEHKLRCFWFFLFQYAL